MPASRSGIASSSEVTPSQRRAFSLERPRALDRAVAIGVGFDDSADGHVRAHVLLDGAKVLRSLVRETSAQVGRVATRARVSTVVATGSIIAGGTGGPE